MRHTCASLLLQHGAAITYVARQLGHRDASTTLRIYAHWLPDVSRTRAVDLLDGTRPAATPAQPAVDEAEWKTALSAYGSVVSRTFASWNQVAVLLRELDTLRRVA
jgi:integrase